MKWREPWKESIKEQSLLPQFGRRFGKNFFILFAVFGAILVVDAFFDGIPNQDIPIRLAGLSTFAAALSAILYLIWRLSPRLVESGPRGIVVSRADELLIIPWQAIASFNFSQGVQPGSLTLQLRSGGKYKLVLPHDAQQVEISKEITEMTSA